ncbi:MAG: hypothetical protein ACNA7Q_04140, partial [Rhodobacterales bacterium]
MPALDPVYQPIPDWPDLIRDIVRQDQVELIGFDELPIGIARILQPVIRHGDAASAVLDRIRLIKEPAALSLHRAGAAICDAMFARLPSMVSIGDQSLRYFGAAAAPMRAKGAGDVLAPGMVLELHPNLFLPGIGGAALGEMVIITEHGAECP